MAENTVTGLGIKNDMAGRIGGNDKLNEAYDAANLDDDLSASLQAELGVTADEANVLIDIAVKSAGANPTKNQVLQKILDLLGLDDNTEVKKEDVLKHDITSVVKGALEELAGSDKIFQADNKEDVQKLKDITGLSEEDVKKLIQYTSGRPGEIMTLLYDSNLDGKLTIEEAMRTNSRDLNARIDKKRTELDNKLDNWKDSNNESIGKDGKGVVGKTRDAGLEMMASFATANYGVNKEEIKSELGRLITGDTIDQSHFEVFKSIMQDIAIKGKTPKEAVDDWTQKLKESDALNPDGSLNKEKFEAIKKKIDDEAKFTQDFASGLAKSAMDAAKSIGELSKGLFEGIKIPARGKGGGGGGPGGG